jgi:hypothetical protein
MTVPNEGATGPALNDELDSDARSKAFIAYELEGHMKLRPAAT